MNDKYTRMSLHLGKRLQINRRKEDVVEKKIICEIKECNSYELFTEECLEVLKKIYTMKINLLIEAIDQLNPDVYKQHHLETKPGHRSLATSQTSELLGKAPKTCNSYPDAIFK